jgi:hypothetical protein
MKQYRKEVKYVISIMAFNRIRPQLDALLHADENSGSASGYVVRSLYFDSIENRDLHDSLDGLLVKGKIRLRIYPPDLETIKLEYKRKYGADGIKEVLSLSAEQAKRMMQADYAFLADMDENPIARRVYTQLRSGAYIPVSVVEYRRKAYVYPPSDVRITFDTDIRTSCVTGGFFDAHEALFPMTDPDLGVLEIKYNDFFPAVLKSIVERIDRIAVSNGKYVQSRLFY